MKNSKLIWLLVVPLSLAAILTIFKIGFLNRIALSGILMGIFNLIPDAPMITKQIIVWVVQSLFLFFLFALAFNAIRKNKPKIITWAIVFLVMIGSHIGLKSVEMAKIEKEYELCYAAQDIVEDLVTKNIYLPNEKCVRVKILTKTDKNRYKAIAKMESEKEYLIEIEDLNEYVQVKMLPTTGLNE